MTVATRGSMTLAIDSGQSRLPGEAPRCGDARIVRERARTRPAHPVQENKIQRSAPNLFRICSQGVPATRRRSRLPGRGRRPAAGPCAGAQAGPHGPDRTAWATGRGPWRGSDGRVARFNPCAAEVADRRHAADRSCDQPGPGSSRVRGRAAGTVPIVPGHSRSPGVAAPSGTGLAAPIGPARRKRNKIGRNPERCELSWNAAGTFCERLGVAFPLSAVRFAGTANSREKRNRHGSLIRDAGTDHPHPRQRAELSAAGIESSRQGNPGTNDGRGGARAAGKAARQRRGGPRGSTGGGGQPRKTNEADRPRFA